MSKRMPRGAGLLAVLLMPCFGQVAGTVADSGYTYGMSNGRLWNQLPKDGKLVYLTGLRDAVEWKVQERGLPDEEYQKEGKLEWAVGFTVGEYIQVLDELYKQPENILIPVTMAVKFYCTPKLTGTWKAGDLESLLIRIRTTADSAQAQAHPPLSPDPEAPRIRRSPPATPAPLPATSGQTSLDPVIQGSREATTAFVETLSHYAAKQYTTRYATAAGASGRTLWQALDMVTEDVIETDGTEKYKNILINGRDANEKSAVKGTFDGPRGLWLFSSLTGSWSRGEFASLLQDVLSPLTNADFRGKRATTMVNRAAFRYDFSVEQSASNWHVEAESRMVTSKAFTQSYVPQYTGSIWIDKESLRVLRIEMSARDIPTWFPLDQVESSVNYDYVLVGGQKLLLATHAEALICSRSTNECKRNVIEFREYKAGRA